jgi:hypothetical protein
MKTTDDERIHTAISVIRGYLHDHGKRLKSEEALKWAQATGRRIDYEGIKYFADAPLPVLEEMVRMAVEKTKQNQEST